MADTVKDKLVDYIRDQVALEKDTAEMLSSLRSTTDDEKLRLRLEHHEQETLRQIDRLEERLAAHDTDSSTAKDTAAQVGATVKGAWDKIRGDKAGRNVRDAYVAEHTEIAAYQLLERVAVLAGDEATAEVARQNRSEEQAMAEFLDGCWDMAVHSSLREEGVLA